MNRPQVQLLRIVRLVIRADSDPARQALFATLLQASLPVRAVFAIYEALRGTAAAAWLVGGFGLASYFDFAPPRGRVRVLGVARHENARRNVERVFRWIGSSDCGLVRSGIATVFERSTLSALRALRAARLRQSLRMIQRLERRYGFLVSSRAAAAIAWYARGRALLDRDHAGALLVSSDSNPEELGLVGAARARGVPQIFVSHAYPTPLSPPLDFSLSLLEGDAAVEARARKGPIRGRVVLAGVEGESAPMDARRLERPNPVIGIFTSKALSWPTLAALVDECRHGFAPRQIVIRWHPSMLERPHLSQVLTQMRGVVESPGSEPLVEVARRCDWVIADENSNVHLPVLKLGIPTIPIKHLGVYPESRSDQYGFAAHGVVFPPVASVRHLRMADVMAFFDEGWRGRFGRYDASYLRPPEAVAGEVRRAVMDVIA